MKKVNLEMLKSATNALLFQGAAAITLLLVFDSAGLAQQAAADSSQPAAAAAAEPAGQASSDGGLGEIIVTAEKRPSNLQRTAISETVISGMELQNRGITDPGSLVGLAPSVQFQPSFLLLTYIRGVGNYSSQPGVDQSIAYNVDGIYLDRPYAVPNILFDLSQIEMLRGPQGTLQGRNSTGGSVNLVTNHPTDVFAASASLTYGNFATVNTSGMINIPLAEGYDLRIAAATNRHDPYERSGFWDGDTSGVRASLLAKPTSGLEILLVGEYSNRRETGIGFSPCPPGSRDAACAGVPWRPFDGTPGQGTDPVNNTTEPQRVTADNSAIYAQITDDLGFGTLTWVPSYRYITYDSVATYSHVAGYAPAVRDALHSQELRLSSKEGSPITWVGGLYYGRQWAREQNYFLTGVEPYITVSQPGFATVGHVYYKNDVDRYVYESKSAFGQATLPIVGGLRVVAGLRYTDDDKDYQGSTGTVIAGPTLISVPVAATQSLSKLTYKAGLEYDLTPETLTYANVSTGFKAGGANGKPPGSDIPATFGPEENTAYQAGVKTRFWDDRAQINTEIFYYKYTGYQTSGYAQVDGVAIGYNINSQKARMYGGEIEAVFLLTPDDRFQPSVSVLSARYVDFYIPAAALDLSGKPMQNAPPVTFSAAYTHTFRLPGGADLAAYANVHHEANQWVDYRLSAGSNVEAFWRADAELTYNSADGKYNVGAYVHNISNNGSIAVANGGLGPYELGLPYPPRTYGVRVTANF